MRKIKFRGKVIYSENNPYNDMDGKWVDGFYIEDLFNGKVESFIFNCPCYFLVNKETVGQFTGLTDKNGKEIYEGDIVLFTWFSYGEYELETEYQGYIDFLNGSFLFCCEHGNYPLSELEFDSESDIDVIGNIHDNPELLTK